MTLPLLSPSLRDLLDAGLDVPGARQIAAPFLPQLALPERGVRAVLLYGSCLWSDLRGAGSHPDFFVIVDSLRGWHQHFWPTLLNRLLPPSIYRLRAGALEAKISITSVEQLARLCSPAAADLHHLGRFSKRIALVWARDPASRELVVDAQEAALWTLAPLTRTRLDVDEFMQELLRLSYDAEVRIAERGKAAKLFSVERAHYRAIGRELLLHLGHVAPAEVARRLRRSRRRAVLRWPKYLCTYDGWLDYVLAKLTRTGGGPSLTARQRKYPLLFGLPVLWRLARTRRLA